MPRLFLAIAIAILVASPLPRVDPAVAQEPERRDSAAAGLAWTTRPATLPVADTGDRPQQKPSTYG